MVSQGRRGYISDFLPNDLLALFEHLTLEILPWIYPRRIIIRPCACVCTGVTTRIVLVVRARRIWLCKLARRLHRYNGYWHYITIAMLFLPAVDQVHWFSGIVSFVGRVDRSVWTRHTAWLSLCSSVLSGRLCCALSLGYYALELLARTMIRIYSRPSNTNRTKLFSAFPKPAVALAKPLIGLVLTISWWIMDWSTLVVCTTWLSWILTCSISRCCKK